MLPRNANILAVFLVLALLVVSAPLVRAEEPPPTPQQIKAVRDAALWVETLSPPQRTAIGETLAQYQSRFDTITRQLRHLEHTQDMETLYLPLVVRGMATGAVASEAEAYIPPLLTASEMAAWQATTARLQALHTEVDTAVSEVLTPEQQAQHEQALAFLEQLSPSAQAMPAATTYEYYSYEANYYAYFFAYYTYYYSISDYAYYAYYYAYYGYGFAYHAYLGY